MFKKCWFVKRKVLFSKKIADMHNKKVDFTQHQIQFSFRSKRRKWYRLTAILFLIWFYFSLPSVLFTDPTSTVLLDRNGELLGARIADDGQWRFEESKTIPFRYATCLTAFEDRDFYWHPGVNPKSVFRAVFQNVSSGERKSGGSTLTMQVVRLYRKNPPRTYPEKLLEMLLALRLEMRYSKEEILVLHASHAPFGNNVVGLNAASWRYFNRPPEQLSWSECAVLAVLPNAPGLIYPGKNQQILLAKRNRLLTYLFENEYFDKTTYQLALEEPLPCKPLPLPRHAGHLLDRFVKSGKKGKTIQSTLLLELQTSAKRQLSFHNNRLSERKIYNGAVIIADVHTGEVLAYQGNTGLNEAEYSPWVDCASAPRSSGSILKPLLYAASLDEGLITPDMLLSDVPTHFGSFSPKNFSGQFDGAVHANKALSRSLNIPMVNLLNAYGYSKFHSDLRNAGLKTISKPAQHYGLSLILGGAEVKLDEVANVYCNMAQKLNNEEQTTLFFDKSDVVRSKNIKYSKESIYLTFNAMQEVNRPDEDNNWKVFSSSKKIAWKTGTSFGFRDGWAIGVTPDYVVGVWIGNADGEGRPGLTGVKAAAPLLFDLFRLLPSKKSWFDEPFVEKKEIKICKKSGYPAGKNCETITRTSVPLFAHFKETCPYHQLVHLDESGQYRVDSQCESVFHMKNSKWFVLPPSMEKYYQLNHPDYKILPKFRSDCGCSQNETSISFVYPRNNSTIYVPIEIDGTKGQTIFEVVHQRSNGKLFWHLDDNFFGTTTDIHQLSARPSVGKHRLTVMDEDGNRASVRFTVDGKQNK